MLWYSNVLRSDIFHCEKSFETIFNERIFNKSDKMKLQKLYLGITMAAYHFGLIPEDSHTTLNQL